MEQLTLENFKEIEPYIKAANYNEYNSNVVTMLMWQIRYPVYFSCYEHFALVYNQMPGMDPVWMMPYCKKEYRSEAIEKIRELSMELGMNFEIHSMIKEFKDWLQEAYPQQFLVWDCYDARDYIYDRKQQESLAGKKMQKRRNHFHAFEKQYKNRYQYKPLKKEDIPHVYEFLGEWKAQKDAMDTIDVEEQGIHFLLDHMDILPIQGGCIYIDGKLEAFNITSLISSDTVQIHVEKANKTMRGLYIAILKLFLETLPEDINYINREDDMGLPELRKAKTDMQPVSKTQKFGSCYEPWDIRKAAQSDLNGIRQLWLDNFEDESEASTAYYFDHFFQIDDCYVLASKDELISMLQMRKMDLMLYGTKERVSFVVGVATNKEYEGCGYMKQLLQYALKIASQTENYALLQAYHWDIYRPFGFEERYHQWIVKIDKIAYTQCNGSFKPCTDSKQLEALYHRFTEDKDGYRIRNKEYYDTLFLPNAALWNQQVLIYEEEDQAYGYIVVEENVEEVHILECIYTDTARLSSMLACFAQEQRKLYVHTDMGTQLEGRKKEVTCMMIASLQHTPLKQTPLFINETI